jgi:hypothetical protein
MPRSIARWNAPSVARHKNPLSAMSEIITSRGTCADLERERTEKDNAEALRNAETRRDEQESAEAVHEFQYLEWDASA